MTMNTAIVPADLIVTNLHKAFGAQPVLGGVDIEVPAGTFAAVLGPSGSGKTTLLRILAGFELPDRGTVSIGETIVDDSSRRHVPTEMRRMGYVSQEGSLFPHLTVEANVTFGLSRRHRSGPGVIDLLDAVGLTHLSHRYPHQLSGGQQQRVALARALAVGPRIVLLDEPFASLDANLRGAVRSDVHAILRDAGATAILVTHDQDEALSIADLVAVIRNGRIAQLGSPQDLYSHPVDADLARFIGEANLVDGIARGSRVETSLGVLHARVVSDASSRVRVTVLIRPEQVVLDTAMTGPGVHGRVREVNYHGHDATLSVVLDADSGIKPIIARVLGNDRLREGSRVSISVLGPVSVWPEPDPAAAPVPTQGVLAGRSQDLA